MRGKLKKQTNLQRKNEVMLILMTTCGACFRSFQKPESDIANITFFKLQMQEANSSDCKGHVTSKVEIITVLLLLLLLLEVGLEFELRALCLSHISNPFCSGYSEDESVTNHFLGLAPIRDPPNLGPQLARIIAMIPVPSATVFIINSCPIISEIIFKEIMNRETL
jgi:hypothetical protein